MQHLTLSVPLALDVLPHSTVIKTHVFCKFYDSVSKQFYVSLVILLYFIVLHFSVGWSTPL